MAHTDRDDERWARRNHNRYECPNAYRAGTRTWGDWTTKSCLICDTEPTPKYWCSTKGKSGWNRDCRQEERSQAKRAIRECRDWDNLTIKYHRPYWD